MPLWINEADLFINNIGPHQYQLEVNQELIEVTSMDSKKPDPHWFTIDNQGHFHTFADDDSLPTLEMHTEETPSWYTLDRLCTYCDSFHANSPVSYYRCRLCQDVVAPNYVADHSPGSDMIPGLVTIFLTVEHFGQNVEIGETVSWYNKTHFGTGKVMSIHLKTGVELLIACDYMAKRKYVDL